MADIDTAAIRAVCDDGGGFNYRQTARVLCDEVDRLRARLAEVEADADHYRIEARGWEQRTREAEARLAEVEAERENLQRTVDYDLRYQRVLEARLAEVEALCEYHKYDGRVPIYPLRAAARGEGDRG